MANLSENALQIANSRYFIYENEGWDNLSIRCGENVARIEKNPLEYKDKFIEIINNLEFVPAGRILRNIGRLRGSLFNCYVIPIADSIEAIGQFMKDALITWSEGGGVGTNLSDLRPTGAPINGKGGNSSGPISFLKAADSLASTIESGGQRRAAGMALMLVNHPDILKFIDAKIVDKIISYFNISVGVNEFFIEAVEKNKQWDLTFNHKKYNTVDANKIWYNIMQNMVRWAEPGLLNWDKLRSNNSYYYEPVIGTNPCGEQALSKYGICDLGSINLTKFVSNVNTNWKRMEEVIRLGIRFLDNIIEINRYILNEYNETAHNSRRVGLGIMGLGDYLFAKKIRYGSKKSISEIEKIMKFVRDISYDESIKLAIEKGAFPKFDPIEYGKAHFIRTLPPSVRIDIKKHGIRNVTLNCIAPTGTTSLIAECSSGLEPIPFKSYLRSDRVSDRIYVHPMYKDFIESGEEIPDWYVDAHEIKPHEHLDVQVACQKYVDNSISKTVNMPNSTTPEDLSELLLEYIHDLKGITVYVDGSREGQILNKISHEETLTYLKEASTIADEETIKCINGKCEL